MSIVTGRRRTLAATACAFALAGLGGLEAAGSAQAATVTLPPAGPTAYFVLTVAAEPSPGHLYFACEPGYSYYPRGEALGAKNNCGVRVWTYNGIGQARCVSPGASTNRVYSWRIWISDNPARC